MKCIYCHPEELGEDPKTRIMHKKCSPVPLKDNVIRKYKVST